MDNIDKNDVKGFRKLAGVMLALSEKELEIMLEKKDIEEIGS